MNDMTKPSRAGIELCDVGPRDGLQSEARVLPPATRADLCVRLLAAGLTNVEAVSFVRDDLIPAMAGAEDVLAGLEPNARSRCSALVLNRRGLERALLAGVQEIHVVVAASNEFSQRNQGASLDEVVAAADTMIGDALGARVRRVRVGISMAFGCPFEGPVDPGFVISIAERLAATGADEIVAADTIGVAVPRDVGRMCFRLSAIGSPFGVHLHDTRNTGVANAWAAVENGASLVESSVGGLGGCPFAPGAGGNVATEDIVYLLERSGVDTGIDLDELCAVVHWLEHVLDRRLPSRLARAGSAPDGTPARGR
jgi:hydroxymethylglutaryl-CoA lyase/(R)-citramalyl-CoA lyase